MTSYSEKRKIGEAPRLPLEGNIDLTYRCNNDCLHCWLRIPPDAPERKQELSFNEIRRIVDEARKAGCRRWNISGGEPMLRPDFAEIFDYITSKSISYTLNTNGTRITAKIAALMKRKGAKMVAIYGATADVHDRITRSRGSFEKLMEGFARLKDAGAGFIVQIIPMRDNYHQYKDMIRLAKSLSPVYRIGAPWLFLSACGDPLKNEDIARQRLSPKTVVDLDKPDFSAERSPGDEASFTCAHIREDDRLYASCLSIRRDFHIDPYGRMTFCSFIKDPTLMYDLKKGIFSEGWDRFIPSLADRIRGGREFRENCGACERRQDCRWCGVYGYLEHGRHSAKVEYLCAVARENRKYKKEWERSHRRFYRTGGFTIRVDSELPITDSTFHPKLKQFESPESDDDLISIHHYFSLPKLDREKLGACLYRRAPWAIYRHGDSFVYFGISPIDDRHNPNMIAVFNGGHTRGRIFHNGARIFRRGNLHSLTLFPSDQILIGRVLADREGCYLHSAGLILHGAGLMFVGHSSAGKSTIVKMLKDKAEILCDDRIIVRKRSEGFRLYGTWSHGEVPIISPSSAPLKAIFFLHKSKENRLERVKNKKEVTAELLACLIKPLATVDWWEKMLVLIEKITGAVPCYNLYFDKSGDIVTELEKLADKKTL